MNKPTSPPWGMLVHAIVRITGMTMLSWISPACSDDLGRLFTDSAQRVRLDLQRSKPAASEAAQTSALEIDRALAVPSLVDMAPSSPLWTLQGYVQAISSGSDGASSSKPGFSSLDSSKLDSSKLDSSKLDGSNTGWANTGAATLWINQTMTPVEPGKGWAMRFVQAHNPASWQRPDKHVDRQPAKKPEPGFQAIVELRPPGHAHSLRLSVGGPAVPLPAALVPPASP
ncbi:hypothetical protein ED236_08540 [Pseudomethylobacillus aquaticus]|uniref:Uncharacterized protein n=1 Tax=Pseudomethylobacillus aquaticus TaxID=2676064 RepID=A0A3N0UZ22_9PROT|nr:hypothetical protein [Pseudomethylobacillus aquaticus]ROH85780.1 hypothetical protein ED236_08540 [Pseudomethylobacillus aquaticus]